MLAGGDQRDVAQEDRFLIAFGFVEDPAEERLRVDSIAGEPFAVGPGHSRGRVPDAFARGIVSGGGDERAHRLLDFGSARAPRRKLCLDFVELADIERIELGQIHATASVLMWIRPSS